MADKDVDGVVAALAGAATLRGATVICTQVDVPRALPAADLARRWSSRVPGHARREGVTTVLVEPQVDAAIDGALARTAGPVVIAGSLYLVGAARARLVDDPLLRDPPAAAP
jgi:folylpolyglutamate synthase/dihydropteroate synthase